MKIFIYFIIKNISKTIILFILFFIKIDILLYCQENEFITIGNYIIFGTELYMYTGEEEHVIIPDNLGITRIGNAAFRPYGFSNRNLKSIVIPKGITSIGSEAFSGCYNLINIILPEGLIRIEEGAFLSCTNIKNIIIPDSVIYIGGGAFKLCQNLENINIPANVVSPIGPFMFNHCLNLTNIIVNEQNPIYSSIDGILFNKDQTTLIKYPSGKTRQIYTIPLSVTAISPSAFEECKLVNIIIHERVISIGLHAFLECEQLIAIIVHEQNMEFTSINGVLFNKNITKLISYPAGIIERIYFMPSSVTIIENRAFFGNHYLEQLIMNLNSRVNIREGAFGDCIKLRTVFVSRNSGIIPRRAGIVNSRYTIFGINVEIVYYDD